VGEVFGTGGNNSVKVASSKAIDFWSLPAFLGKVAMNSSYIWLLTVQEFVAICLDLEVLGFVGIGDLAFFSGSLLLHCEP